jgi:hypothetical protein
MKNAVIRHRIKQIYLTFIIPYCGRGYISVFLCIGCGVWRSASLFAPEPGSE